MSKNNNANVPTQPVFIMTPPQPQPQPQQSDGIFDGLGGLALSVVAGLILGQFGFGLPRFPKI